MKKNIKTIIIDDNEDWRENLAIRVNAHPDLTLIGSFDTPMLAYNLIAKEEVDLILLDIEMPEMNGINFIRYLSKPPMVILVTAHRDFAVEGYEIQAIDYLVKPFTNERFTQAIKKIATCLEEKRELKQSKQFFFIKENNKFVKIEISDIIFIKALENYVQITMLDHTYTTLMSLATVEEYLPTDIFLRVHRSFLVNILKISVIQKTELSLGSYKVPIGRAYTDNVFDTLIKTHLIVKVNTLSK